MSHPQHSKTRTTPSCGLVPTLSVRLRAITSSARHLNCLKPSDLHHPTLMFLSHPSRGSCGGLRAEYDRRRDKGRYGRGRRTYRDVAEVSELRGRKRASWSTQFRILSGRAFKNLYRDPALLAAHYLSSIALACESFPPSIYHCLLTDDSGPSDLWIILP
jgi:hypothetical protein